jgi:hypothetical protein
MRFFQPDRYVALLAGAVAALAAGAALAQTSPGAAATSSLTPTEQLLADPFVLDLGGFIVSSNIDGSLSGNANTENQNLDFNKTFGTNADQTRVRADFLWRITPRQAVSFSYFNNSVTSTRTLDQDIPWGDYTFLANAQVTAQTKFNIYEGTYQFALLNNRDYKLALSAGLHVEELTIKLAGNASVTLPDGTVHSAGYSTQSNSLTAPLPVLGLSGEWAATPHLYVDASAQIFAYRDQGIDGNWSLLWAGATWMFNHHFGVGLAYNRFQTNLDLDKGSFNGRLNFGYQGAVLYVKGGF